MENQLLWKDEYNIGVDIIDKEHQRLFKIINKLFRFGGEKNKSQWACQEGIKFFKDHAVKHFADEEEYMASIHYEQFQKVFESEQLQVSLLFDTGEGYFSYCALAPHLLKKGSATPINIDNAMTEVEEYLRKREEPAKPKVLVVDDSITVREMIKNLLDEDYDETAQRYPPSPMRFTRGIMRRSISDPVRIRIEKESVLMRQKECIYKKTAPAYRSCFFTRFSVQNRCVWYGMRGQ